MFSVLSSELATFQLATGRATGELQNVSPITKDGGSLNRYVYHDLMCFLTAASRGQPADCDRVASGGLPHTNLGRRTTWN